VILYNGAYYQVFASSSPTFGMQSVNYGSQKWIDVWRGKYVYEGPNYTDIQSINYHSNGKFLNVTLWLDSFQLSFLNDSRINYGMYIDADFNNKTGNNGIDYKVEVQWNGTSKSWTRVFEQWASNGDERVLDVDTNYSGFYDSRNESEYVLLYADLDALLSPSRYKVLFYSEEIKTKEFNWIMDSSKWIYIPPPEFILTVSPDAVDIRAGEQKTVEVQINSTKGFQPLIYLQTPNEKDSDATFSYRYNKIEMPSFGQAATPLIINVPNDALRFPHTVRVSANFVFPSEEFVIPGLSSEKIVIPTENVTAYSSFIITIKEPLNILDIINEIWSKSGDFINFIYLVGGALASWIFSSYLRKKKIDKDNQK
jgi:hypothetical protein